MTKVYKSPAKINLCLDILNKDISGFHKIRSVIMEYPELFDEISIEKSAKLRISFKPEISCPISESSVYKAAKLILPKGKGANITVYKNIPEKSGLGGGASNAATVLKAINEIYNLGCTNNKLQIIGANIGMDVPFFIEGKTALAANFGEKIKPLPDAYKLLKENDFSLKILETGIKIDTKSAYKNIDLSKCAKFRKLTDIIVKAIKTKNIDALLENLHNDFEISIFHDYPFIIKLDQTALAQKALSVNLTGSGGTLFAIFKSA